MASSNRSSSVSRRTSQRQPNDDDYKGRSLSEFSHIDPIIKAIEDLQTKSAEYDSLKQRVDQMAADLEEVKGLITNNKSTSQSFQLGSQPLPSLSNTSDLPLEQQSEYALKNINEVVEKIISERRVLLIQLEDKEKEVESYKRTERQCRKQVKQLQEELSKSASVSGQRNDEATEKRFEEYESKLRTLELERDNLRVELDQEKRNLRTAQDEMEAHRQTANVYKQDFEEERKAREKLASQLESLKGRSPSSQVQERSSVIDRTRDPYREKDSYSDRSSGASEKPSRTSTLPNRFSNDYSSFMAGGIHRSWKCKHCSTNNIYSDIYCKSCSRMHIS